MHHFPGMPMLGAEDGAPIDHLMWLVHLTMAGAFLLWGGFFALALIRFRAGRHPRADYRGLRSKAPHIVVALLAVVELCLLAFLSVPFLNARLYASGAGADGSAVEVRIVAQQFQWNVHYPGADGVFGRTAPEFVDDARLRFIGLDPKDPSGADDIVTNNTLHLPADRAVLIRLSTRDVIHSFFLPEFRVKQDAIPGMEIPIRFTPNKTTAEIRAESGDSERNLEIACAQLCGLGHYTMRGTLVVETQGEFDAWLAAKSREQQAAADDWP